MAFVNYRCCSVLDNSLVADLTVLTANLSHSNVLGLIPQNLPIAILAIRGVPLDNVTEEVVVINFPKNPQ